MMCGIQRKPSKALESRWPGSIMIFKGPLAKLSNVTTLRYALAKRLLWREADWPVDGPTVTRTLSGVPPPPPPPPKVKLRPLSLAAAGLGFRIFRVQECRVRFVE